MTDKDYTFTWILGRIMVVVAVGMIFIFVGRSLDIWQQHVDQEEIIAHYNSTDSITSMQLRQMMEVVEEREMFP